MEERIQKIPQKRDYTLFYVLDKQTSPTHIYSTRTTTMVCGMSHSIFRFFFFFFFFPPQDTNFLSVCYMWKPVVVMPRTILPQRNRRCTLSATSMWKSEEEKDARGGTCFMEENEISLREVMRFDEHKRDCLKWKGAAFCWCLISAHPSVHFAS